jgi:hypothetical protein
MATVTVQTLEKMTCMVSREHHAVVADEPTPVGTDGVWTPTSYYWPHSAPEWS